MFEEIAGIPAHPLLVHGAVVFVPLLALIALGYALVPQLRGRLGWLAALLAIIAPIAALLAKLSGDAFRARQVKRGLGPGELLTKIDNHRHYGTMTVWFTLALALATLALWYVRRSESTHKSVDLGLRAVVTVLAVIAGYYVYKTGDSGAHMVWGNS